MYLITNYPGSHSTLRGFAQACVSSRNLRVPMQCRGLLKNWSSALDPSSAARDEVLAPRGVVYRAAQEDVLNGLGQLPAGACY